MKTELHPEQIDDHSGNVVSTEKDAVFKSLLRLCQVLTASNTFPLNSYDVLVHVHTTSSACLLRSYYDHSDHTTYLSCIYHARPWPSAFLLRSFRSHHVQIRIYSWLAPVAQQVECPLQGTGGHRSRHTKVVKNGTSCSSLGTQTYGVELGLVEPVSV